MKYQKHRLNIFPEMSAEDYERLKSDIAINGYDETQPIWLFEGEIIDGWNRQKAALDLGITPVYSQFDGSELDAINFVMRTNKRRNLTSSQWAAIAVNADEIVQAIEKAVEEERRKKIAKNQTESNSNSKKQMAELIPPSVTLMDSKEKQAFEARTKIAETFNTNPRYISDAKKLKQESPEDFKKVLNGEVTITKLKKQQQIKDSKEKRLKDERSAITKAPVLKIASCIDYLKALDSASVDLLITDPPYLTEYRVAEFKAFTEKWLSLIVPVMKKTSRIYICAGAYPDETLVYLSAFNKILAPDGWIVDNPLIWTYRNTLGQTPKMKYNLNYQLIWHLYRKDSRELDTSVTKEMFSVQDINAPDGRLGDRYHTWQKPNELARRLITHSSNNGDKVIDCFACTGTFIVEAARLGRNAEGCEIDRDNAEIAKQRGCDVQ